MEIIEWFFAFSRPLGLREIARRREDWRCVFGHVQAYGYTMDDAWLFFDPQGIGSSIRITHLHDEVLEHIATIRCTSEWVLSIKPDGRRFRLPFHPPMNCVTQCSSLIGRRAYTPWGFRQMLLREGAEVIWERAREDAEGRSEGQGSPPEGAAHS